MSEIINYEIRPVKTNDMESLIQLCSGHAEYEGAAYSKDSKLTQLSDHLFAEESPLNCLVVEQKGELVGYMTFMKQYSTWDAGHYIYMDCLYLKSEARNKGIGKRLMEQITAYAQSENCNEIQWQTPASNTKAIKFYKQNGANGKSKVRFFLSTS